jgi:hypothetical protein
MKNTKQLIAMFSLAIPAIVSLPVSITTAFGEVQSPVQQDDGSIKGYFVANSGGVDFSIDPANPSG